MIKPTKFLDLDNCLISVVTDILEILLRDKSVPYNYLYEVLKKKYKKKLDYIFLPSIDFLFLIGKLNYSPSTDCLELIL